MHLQMPYRNSEQALESAILALLQARARGKTICPSEASRAVFGTRGNDRERMDRTRAAAKRLVEAGVIVVTQRGREVDLDGARGPIRLRLK